MKVDAGSDTAFQRIWYHEAEDRCFALLPGMLAPPGEATYLQQPEGGAQLDLSLVIVTRNEEKHLARCFESVPFAGEVLVVDSGSTDSTIGIARTLGCRVMHHSFTDYSSQKQWALEQARYDWVLFLDADEYLDPDLSGAIRSLLLKGPDRDGYRLRFRMLYMGRLMRLGPWSGESHLRLIRKASASFSGSHVHEGLVLESGRPGILRKGHVVHESYEDLSEQIDKMRAYASMWARGEHSAGRRAGPSPMILRPLWRLFSSCILRGGILEGVPGLTASVVASFYVFLKWSMLREMTMRSNPGGEDRVR